MSRSAFRRRRFLAFVAWTALILAGNFRPASSQSLEDKLSGARRQQAQNLLGVDAATLDSVIAGKKKAAAASGQGPRFGYSDQDLERDILDSLISGPKSIDSLGLDPFADYADIDTTLLDSAAKAQLRKRKAAKPLPKRYEQRIFQSIDRSAFTSTMGAVGRDYILGPGDGVTVSLWGDKEKEYQLVVNSQGALFLEGVGMVPVAGLKVAEAESRLKASLSRIYSGIHRGTAFVALSVGRAGPKKIFILGEVKVPGGFVFTGHTSVLAAMYASKGPTDIGTVRNLILNRNGQKYPIDLYAYLMRGETPKPDVLQDGDVLFAGRAEALVEVTGDVGRPATYEMKAGEGVKELLAYAGGLNPTAARQKITLQRVFPDGRVDYLDIPDPRNLLESGDTTVTLHDGDRLLVEKSNEETHGFVTVSGPVKYPGTYQSEGVTTLEDLVARAGGLKEDAFLGRAHVLRTFPDGSSELFAFRLDTQTPDSVQIRAKDNVILYSQKEMYLPDSVRIEGAVFSPGKYEYRKGMTAKDLIMQAGGLLPNHEPGRILLFRGDTRERKVDHRDIEIATGLDKSEENSPLEPKDLIHVPIDPLWYDKEIVSLEGLFVRPGKYALLHPGERLSSVIKRAGGFKEDAYIQGGRYFRSRDSVGRVGVDVEAALRHIGRRADIPMVGGDSLYIPEIATTVKVIGEVGFETSVLYKEGASADYYIERAGGFTRRSEKDKVVIQYANGESSRNGVFNRKPDAGSVIYVPQGPEPKPIDWFSGTNLILGTLTTSVTLLLLINQL